MELIYANEHTSCQHYMSDIKVGFRHITTYKDETLEEGETTLNYMFFVLRGELIISSDECANRRIHENEFLLFPKSTYRKGLILGNSELVVLSFNWINNLCDRISIMEFEKLKDKATEVFQPLPIKAPMQAFFVSLCVYLKDGAKCVRLHELKLAELLWVLRTYYSKEELTELFHPIISKSLKFRDKVLSIYQSTGTAQELALKCGYTRQAFGKLFLEEFGETTYVWMQKQMLTRIKARLADPTIQLQEIVSEFNLSSLPHLNRLCKKHFGKTPAALRKEMASL